ncbi:cytochrome c3 family protein [Tundrisphaera lichenicola]|uniref:cytochrome c3 family protein n=1 Tax=Tundrisphaera lichenicola TaxID=2029860 RepID=UPI003EC11A14
MVETGPTNDRPRDPRKVREALVIVGGTLVLIAGLAWWLGRPSPVERPRFSVALEADRVSLGPYIGAQSCGECHPIESARYPRSGHAKTLRPATGLPLTRQLAGRTEVDPERPDVHWSYDIRDGEFWIERKEGEDVERNIVDFAFGSGHHATTFLTLLDPSKPIVKEHRLTHYTDGDALKITPGQRSGAEAPGTTPEGRKPTPAVALKCFRCHSTRTAAVGDGLNLREMIPNVSCERCHGPARKHVEDARAGRAHLRMAMGPGSWTAQSQLSLCGQCHRDSSRMMPGEIRPENPGLARFQPVGISQSACYTESAGAFSCVTCHDPHARVSSDRIGYEKACLNCHAAAPATTCPVSPRDGCIGCHMPKVDTGQHVAFTDHWIRARPGTATPPVHAP